MKKNKGLSLKDIIIVILVFLFSGGIFYYYFGYRNFQSQVDKYKTDQLESEIEIYEQQLAKMQEMQNYIDAHINDDIGTIELYNNLGNEIDEIDRIFDGIEEMTITWAYPTLLDGTVRRQATIVFITYSYDDVLRLLDELNNNRYRSVILSVNTTADKNKILADGNKIRTNVVMTFFEKVNSDTNLAGLRILDEKKK